MSVDVIRILIADDHPFFRDGLCVLLEATLDMDLVGEANDGDEVISLAQNLQPEVLLMDLRMPGSGGIEANRKTLRENP